MISYALAADLVQAPGPVINPYVVAGLIVALIVLGIVIVAMRREGARRMRQAQSTWAPTPANTWAPTPVPPQEIK